LAHPSRCYDITVEAVHVLGNVGGHQQRQHVEPLNAVVAHQLGARPDNVYNLGGDLRTVPRPAVYQRLTINAQRTLVT
jgi:hypothetical protein